MFANERQEEICALLSAQGAVTTAGLTEKFGVSIETVRKDLLALENAHRLQRVHGGAVQTGAMKPFHTLSDRTGENADRKKELAEAAVSFLRDGDSVFIDAGSTAAAFALALRALPRQLTIATHSLTVFELLKPFAPILCGGHFLPEENAFYGPLALDFLSRIHIGKLFLFPSAVSLHYGICDYQKDLFLIQRACLAAADQVYILADSSKFEQTALLKIGEMNPAYTYITDSALPGNIRELYRENNITVIAGKEQIK